MSTKILTHALNMGKNVSLQIKSSLISRWFSYSHWLFAAVKRQRSRNSSHVESKSEGTVSAVDPNRLVAPSASQASEITEDSDVVLVINVPNVRYLLMLLCLLWFFGYIVAQLYNTLHISPYNSGSGGNIDDSSNNSSSSSSGSSGSTTSDNSNNGKPQRSKSSIIRVLEYLLSLLSANPEQRTNPSPAPVSGPSAQIAPRSPPAQFFRFLNLFARTGVEERKALQDRGVLGLLLQVTMCHVCVAALYHSATFNVSCLLIPEQKGRPC